MNAILQVILAGMILFQDNPAKPATPPIVKVRICQFASSTPRMTNAKADEILAFCTKIMAANNCPIIFVREDDIKIIPDDKYSGILTNSNYNYYNTHFKNYNIRIYNDISECSNYPGTFAGCSSVNVHKMAVNCTAQLKDYSLMWLHEFGHNCGLPDISPATTGAYDYTKIMNGILSDSNRGLRMNECKYYESTAKTATIGLVEIATGDEMNVLAQVLQKAISVTEFVHSTFPEGIPFDEVKRQKYTKADAQTLVDMLTNKDEEFYWPNIVTTLCYIGDPIAVEPLIKFFQSGEGKLSPKVSTAKNSVLLNLGVLVNQTGSQEGLKYLTDSVSDDGNWSRKLTWTPFGGGDNGLQDRRLIYSALSGLASTGKPEALAKLDLVKNNAIAAETIRRANFFAEIGKDVMENGIANYHMNKMMKMDALK